MSQPRAPSRPPSARRPSAARGSRRRAQAPCPDRSTSREDGDYRRCGRDRPTARAGQPPPGCERPSTRHARRSGRVREDDPPVAVGGARRPSVRVGGPRRRGRRVHIVRVRDRRAGPDGSIDEDEARRPDRRSGRPAPLGSRPSSDGLPEPVVLVVDDVQAVRSSCRPPCSPRSSCTCRRARHSCSRAESSPSCRSRDCAPIARCSKSASRTWRSAGATHSCFSAASSPELETVADELWERTEGWASGLHLAGLVLARRGRSSSPGRRVHR